MIPLEGALTLINQAYFKFVPRGMEKDRQAELTNPACQCYWICCGCLITNPAYQGADLLMCPLNQPEVAPLSRGNPTMRSRRKFPDT